MAAGEAGWEQPGVNKNVHMVGELLSADHGMDQEHTLRAIALQVAATAYQSQYVPSAHQVLASADTYLAWLKR